jgi:hypothetical protein
MTPAERKAILKDKKLPIRIAWALVAFADRLNKGAYIKFPECDAETGNVTQRPNRELISDQITLGLCGLTEADYTLGDKFAEHFQGLIFDALGGKSTEFDQKIINLISESDIEYQSMAFLACMGARYHRDTVKEYKNEMMFKLGSTSQHQGTIGEHLRLNVTVLSKYEGKAFPGSVVRATDGTNLYFWSSSKMIDMWPDSPEQFPIVGVVKAHGIDRDNYTETRLTRVKITL